MNIAREISTHSMSPEVELAKKMAFPAERVSMVTLNSTSPEVKVTSRGSETTPSGRETKVSRVGAPSELHAESSLNLTFALRLTLRTRSLVSMSRVLVLLPVDSNCNCVGYYN